MRPRFRAASFVIALIVYLAAAAVPSAALVTYNLTIELTWDGNDFFGSPVTDAHLSHLGVATHRAGFSFWEPGQLASPGIELMAETGCVVANQPSPGFCNFANTWATEAATAMVGGNAGSFLAFPQQFAAPSSTTLTFEITEAFSLLTIATMIGPSPDWFVGISGLDLFQGGAWRELVVLPMLVYDGGTEDGIDFALANPATNPAQPIQIATPFGMQSIGSFTLELQTVPESGTFVLMGLGCSVLSLLRRRRNRN